MTPQTTLAYGIARLGDPMPPLKPSPTMTLQKPAKPAKTKRAPEDYSTPYKPVAKTPAAAASPAAPASPASPASPAAPAATAATAPEAAVAATTENALLVLPDPNNVLIEDGIPLPTRALPRHNWQPLLRRLQVGQSAALPIRAKAVLSKDITAAHAAKLGAFVTKLYHDAGLVRVWRKA